MGVQKEPKQLMRENVFKRRKLVFQAELKSLLENMVLHGIGALTFT